MVTIVAIELTTVRETNQKATFAEMEWPRLIGDFSAICQKNPSPNDRLAGDAPNDVAVAGDNEREGEALVAVSRAGDRRVQRPALKAIRAGNVRGRRGLIVRLGRLRGPDTRQGKCQERGPLELLFHRAARCNTSPASEDFRLS